MLALLLLALAGSAVARPQLLPPVFPQPVGFPAAPVPQPFVKSAFVPAFAPSAHVVFKQPITTVQRVYQADDSGQFTSSHTDSAGTNFQETGSYAPTNDGLDKVLVKTGSFSYTSPEGNPVSVTYTADAHGYHPISNSIPVQPHSFQPSF